MNCFTRQNLQDITLLNDLGVIKGNTFVLVIIISYYCSTLYMYGIWHIREATCIFSELMCVKVLPFITHTSSEMPTIIKCHCVWRRRNCFSQGPNSGSWGFLISCPELNHWSTNGSRQWPQDLTWGFRIWPHNFFSEMWKYTPLEMLVW